MSWTSWLQKTTAPLRTEAKIIASERTKWVEAPAVRTVVWLRQRDTDTVHRQRQCHQTNQKPGVSQKVKTHWGAALLCEGEIPWWWHWDRRHWWKKTTGRLAYKTHWTCSISNTMPWNWDHLWGAMKWLVPCPLYDSVLEEVIGLKHCTLDTCDAGAMCVYLQRGLD